MFVKCLDSKLTYGHIDIFVILGAKQFNVKDPITVTESLPIGHISKGEGGFNINVFTNNPIRIPINLYQYQYNNSKTNTPKY